MCAMLVCTFSVLPDCFDFQSFTILCKLDTIHPQLLKILKLSCNLQQLHYGTIHVLAYWLLDAYI